MSVEIQLQDSVRYECLRCVFRMFAYLLNRFPAIRPGNCFSRYDAILFQLPTVVTCRYP